MIYLHHQCHKGSNLLYCMFLIQRYEVQDCKFYDDQSTNKVSRYSSIYGNPTISYSSQYLTIGGSNSAWNISSPIEVSTSDNWCFEADCMFNSNDMPFCGIALSKKSTPSNILSFIGYTTSISSFEYGNSVSAVWVDNSYNVTKGNWYHFKWECVNGKLIYSVFDSQETLITTTEITIPSNYQNTNVYLCITKYGDLSNTNKYFRNIKVKPL